MAVSRSPADTYRGIDVVNDITKIATSLGVDPAAAIADAYHESGLNPNSVGDGGTSFGLYQLHEGGELNDLPGTVNEEIQQAYNPIDNATEALGVVANVRKQEPDASWGQVFADAERPADKGAYADAVNSLITQESQGAAWLKAAEGASYSGPPVGSATGQATPAQGQQNTQGFDASDITNYVSTISSDAVNDTTSLAGDITGPLGSLMTDVGNGLTHLALPGFEQVAQAFKDLDFILNSMEWILNPTNELRVVMFVVGGIIIYFGVRTTLNEVRS